MSIDASGESINFLKQPWIPWMEYPEFVEFMQQLRGRRFIITNLADVSIGNVWNEEIIMQIFGPNMGHRILNIPRIPYPFSDQVFWKNNQKGQFSVKEAYLVDQSWRFAPVKDIWKWIWNGQIHPRNSVMLWRTLNEAIPTRNRLPFLREKSCCLCGMMEEDTLLLFRDCGFSKAVWLGGKYPIRIDCIPGDTMISFVENLLLTFSDFNRFELLNFCGCLGDSPSTNLVSSGNLILEVEARGRMAHHVLFTDASWSNGESGIAAIGVDTRQGIWFVKACKEKAQSVLEAELKAILLVVSWAVERGWNQVHILSDSYIAVKALVTDGRPPDWKLSSVYFSILNMSKKLLNCVFFFIKRCLNFVADGVVKNTRISSDNAVLYQGEGVSLVIPIYFSS
uniref:RNase H type-1 domain-containing protein n=1 Tax=Cannabis sativa TaxID=3483 RepID=A0A803NT04_CANSA